MAFNCLFGRAVTHTNYMSCIICYMPCTLHSCFQFVSVGRPLDCRLSNGDRRLWIGDGCGERESGKGGPEGPGFETHK